MLVKLVETFQLPDKSEHEFRGRRLLGVADGEHGRHVGTQMVVDEYLLGRRTAKGTLHFVNATGYVEVEAEHKVGNLEE
jgi:hypothetical protein